MLQSMEMTMFVSLPTLWAGTTRLVAGFINITPYIAIYSIVNTVENKLNALMCNFE